MVDALCSPLGAKMTKCNVGYQIFGQIKDLIRVAKIRSQILVINRVKWAADPYTTFLGVPPRGLILISFDCVF